MYNCLCRLSVRIAGVYNISQYCKRNKKKKTILLLKELIGQMKLFLNFTNNLINLDTQNTILVEAR